MVSVQVGFSLAGLASREHVHEAQRLLPTGSRMKNESRLASARPPASQPKDGHHTFDSTNGLFGLMGEVGPWVRESRDSWRYMLSW